MNLTQSFQSARAVKVLAVPLGENSLFDQQFRLVASLGSLQLMGLNRPSNWKKTFMKNFDWSNGSILFEYLRYDKALYGNPDAESLQVR